MRDPYDKEGGAAFPRAGSDHNVPESGMTLRDWFAGQALLGELTQPWPEGFDLDEGAEMMANRAYALADAMLAKRTKE